MDLKLTLLGLLALGVLYLVLLLVTILHEFGHFLAMKTFGVGVYLVQVGLGPEVFRFRCGVTDFVLRAIPLGGASGDPWGLEEFVKPGGEGRRLVIAQVDQRLREAGFLPGDLLEGIEDLRFPSAYQVLKLIKERRGGILSIVIRREGKKQDVSCSIPETGEFAWTLVLDGDAPGQGRLKRSAGLEREELTPEIVQELLDPLKRRYLEDPRRLRFQFPVWKNFLITFAGPLANYLTAVAIIFFWLILIGQRTLPQVFLIDDVLKHSPAAEAGLIRGDQIVGIGGESVKKVADLQKSITYSGGEALHIEVLRDGLNKKFLLTPRERQFEYLDGQTESRYMLGVLLSYQLDRLSPLSAFHEAFLWPLVFFEEEVRRIWYLNALPRRKVPPPPMEDLVKRLFQVAVFFAPLVFAGISVLLALLYLFLPHPAGDGYRMVALFFSRRPVLSERARNVLGIFVQVLLYVFLAITLYKACGERVPQGSEETVEGFQIPARQPVKGIVPTRALIPPL